MENTMQGIETDRIVNFVPVQTPDTARGKTKLIRTEAMNGIKDAIQDINQTVSCCINERQHAVIIEKLITVLQSVGTVLNNNLKVLEDSMEMGNDMAVGSTKVQASAASQGLPEKPRKTTERSAKKQTEKHLVEKPTKSISPKVVQPKKTVPTDNPNPWLTVAKKGIWGSRKDKLVVNPLLQEDQLTDIVDLSSPAEIKQLTREPRIPQEHQIVVMRYNNVASRKDVPVRVWREKFRQQNIKVHSIVFPSWGSVEIIAAKEEEVKIRKFFKGLNRTPEDSANPFAQKTSQGKMTPEIAAAICKSRIQMMMYEKSLITLRYLKECVVSGMTLLDEKSKKLVQLDLTRAQKALKI